MRRSWILIAPYVTVAIVGLVACGRDGTVEPARRAALPGPLALVSPVNGGRFVQNDASLGCPAHAARGYGFRLAFDWRDVAGASAYKVVFWHTGAKFAAVERVVVASSYEATLCNAFVADFNLDHWVWRVAALAPAEGSAPRDTLWSEEREYGFEPCRVRDTVPCSAPPD